MAYVPIPKDLTKIKAKVALNLTKRQLVCFGAAVLIGVPLFIFTKDTLSTSGASMLMILVMLPCFLFAMYEKHGRPLEKIIRDIIQTKFISVRYRPYQTDNFYTALVRQNTLEKEIKAIVSIKAKEAKAKN